MPKRRAMLRETYPGLQIVGRRHGYFGRDDEDEICDEINLTQPDVIWVGLSVPLEYEFAVRNKTRLRAGWLVTCGGCYNFVTGAYKRAPRLDAGRGLEWLFRLIREPKRLFWRYAVTNPLAIFLLLTRTSSPADGAVGLSMTVTDIARTAGSGRLARARRHARHRAALWRCRPPVRWRCRRRISWPR